MCDTMVALAGSTVDGATLFAKNSDRERNEAQYLDIVPRRRWRARTSVGLTHVAIPQVRETHAVLLSKPFWMWGAEIGANEHGVVIGNEAVYGARQPSTTPGVLGMDYLRLGLERGSTAEEALNVIVGLLERHGQGGNCGHLTTRGYHNSFIVADATDAWVLETIGRDWVAERVRGTRSISNALSIGSDRDRIGERTRGRLGDASFAATMTNPRRDGLSQGHRRCGRSTEILAAGAGQLDLHAMMAALRDHGPAGRDWRPDQTATKTICMHAAWGTSGGQTTAAMVSWLKPKKTPVHWVTGSAAPCLSVFKPLFLDLGLPVREPKPDGRFNPRSRWWAHERLHRAVLTDFQARSAAFAAERDALEARFARRIARVVGADAETRRSAVRACWAEADAAERRWEGAVAAIPTTSKTATAYRRAWARFDRLAEVPDRAAF